MDISRQIEEYANRKRFYDLQCDDRVVKNLLLGSAKYALCKQPDYADSDLLADNVRESVEKYTRDKMMAISI